MKRASSPPEATFISGDKGVPGFAATTNSTRSMPCRPGLARIAADLRFKPRLLKLEWRQFRKHGLVQFPRHTSCAPHSRHRPPYQIPSAPPHAGLPVFPAAARHRSSADNSFSNRSRVVARSSTVHLCLRAAARKANSRSSDFSSSAGLNENDLCASARDPVRLVHFNEHLVERRTGLIQSPACSFTAALQFAQGRIQPCFNAITGQYTLGLAQCAAEYCSACIISWRALASFVSSSACGSRARNSSTACSM